MGSTKLKNNMALFKPEDFHEVYLKTAKELGWPVRPEMDVPYEQLSNTGKALDIALVDFCNAKLQKWLDAAPTVYATKVFTSTKDESLRWTAPTEPLHGVCFATRKAKLVCIESIKKPHHNDEHETT